MVGLIVLHVHVLHGNLLDVYEIVLQCFSTPSPPHTLTHALTHSLTHTLTHSQVYMDWANHYLRKAHYTQTLTDLHECVQGDNLPKIIHAVGELVNSVKNVCDVKHLCVCCVKFMCILYKFCIISTCVLQDTCIMFVQVVHTVCRICNMCRNVIVLSAYM